MTKFSRFLAVAALLSLTGCETMNRTMTSVRDKISSIEMPSLKSSNKTAAAEDAAPLVAAQKVDCPRVGVVDELNSLTQFVDDGADGTEEGNEISTVRITGVNSACSINDSNIVVDMDIGFDGKLGPRAKVLDTDKPSFAYPYFIAITTPVGSITAKEVFAATIAFERDKSDATHAEQLRQVIPLTGEYNAKDYEILVGFQLTPTELAYNRGGGAAPAPQAAPDASETSAAEEIPAPPPPEEMPAIEPVSEPVAEPAPVTDAPPPAAVQTEPHAQIMETHPQQSAVEDVTAAEPTYVAAPAPPPQAPAESNSTEPLYPVKTGTAPPPPQRIIPRVVD